MTRRRDDAARLLAHLWARLDDDDSGLVELRPIGGAGAHRGRRWISPADARAVLPGWLEECDRQGWHAFYGVLPRARRGGKAADLGAMGGVVWADLDTRPENAPKGAMNRKISDDTKTEVKRRLALVRWRPSAVVLTGGGAHAYWRLAEPTPVDVCAALSLRLSATIGGDLNACDMARILRLPGSLNPKYAPAYPVRLWHLDDDDAGVDPRELDDDLPTAQKTTARRGAAERKKGKAKGTRGGGSKGKRRAFHPAQWAAEIDALRRTPERDKRDDDEMGRAERTFALGVELGRVIRARRAEILAASVAAGLDGRGDEPDARDHLDRGIFYGMGAMDELDAD